jgi:hypothetical protein
VLPRISISTSDEDRRSILDRTAGSLTRQEADELERIIAEGCGMVDRGIAQSLADFKAGRAYGPFRTHAELISSLHAEARKLRASKKPKRASRARID